MSYTVGHPCAQQRQGRDHPLFRVMTKAKPLPPVELVRELFDYDQETGVLIWRAFRLGNAKAGDVAGSLHRTGYIFVKVCGSQYKAHRLAWIHVTGIDPLDSQIDHIDGNKTNNRFANLREATSSQNRCNSKRQINNQSGYKGVVWAKDQRKWRAQIYINKRKVFLGYFDIPELAHMAYCKAAAELHGEFARAM